MSADVIPPVMSALKAEAPTLLGALPLKNLAIANNDNSESELSEIEEDGTPAIRAPAAAESQEVGDAAPNAEPEQPQEQLRIEPHHWDDGVPVFKPSMEEFANFEEYMSKVNEYGMQTGIVKVIPPKEWLDEQPELGEIVKGIRAPNPIIQEIMSDGSGTRDGYRILNLQAPKTYNLPGWGKLCQRPEHQPPARRGERRAQVEKPKRGVKKEKAKKEEDGAEDSNTKGRPAKKQKTEDERKDGVKDKDRLPTPTSPNIKPTEGADTVKSEPVEPKMPRASRGIGRMGRGGSTATTVSSRRKNASKGEANKINEADFVDFEYKLDISDYTPERCAELERAYWKTLTYAPPLYGADMLGSLFDEKTKAWNLGNLPNLLDVMGTKIPGVNTAYLYLGMWKATFAWHLEDVDLYSINYLHFGAPKQWYSISQKDARKFEAAMASIWPQDAKACDQFLRHKTFLISPSTLLNKYGVKVNRTTHYPGEFVITFPYGYHSGFNMGYNCAEAVNFALPSWLEMGRIAKKCDCEQAQDSVWIDVAEIERKMRGEDTEFEDSDEEEEEEDDEGGPTDLPTPPESSGDNKLKKPARKRKRVPATKRDAAATNKLRIRLKTHNEPCCLCPNDIKGQQLLTTDDGRKAHRICAEYTPETDIENNIVYGVTDINKDRLELKCIFCRSRKGAKIQCSQKKCVRSYHATCAAAAGMFVEQGDIPVFGEDGTEYKTAGCEFSCRFHRAKRDKKLTGKSLEDDNTIQAAATALNQYQICQFQLPQKDIFAGIVLENRRSEGTVLLEILPSSEKFEIEYKYLLLAQPSDYHLEKPSEKALPLPKSRKAKDALNTSNRKADDLPRKDDVWIEGLTWAEFSIFNLPKNPEQVKVNFAKDKQIMYYLGDISKESTAYYTADYTKPVYDPSCSFLNTIPKPAAQARPSYSTTFPRPPGQSANNNPMRPPQKQTPILPPGYTSSGQKINLTPTSGQKAHKPYEYKPRIDTYKGMQIDTAFSTQRPQQPQQPQQQQRAPYTYAFGTDPNWSTSGANSQPKNSYGVQSQMLAASLPYPTTYMNGNGNRPEYLPQPQSSGYFVGQGGRNGQQPSHQSQTHGMMPQQGASERMLQKTPAARQQQLPVDFNAIFMKYPYLRKEHNRPPTSYKSPYRQDALGFCNGYEGDFKAHMAAQMAKDPNFLLKTPLTSMNRMSSNTPSQPAPSYEAPSRTYAPILPPPRKSYGASGQSSTSTPASLKQTPVGPSTQQSFMKPPVMWEKKEAGLHPAIRQNYGGGGNFHNNYRPSSPGSSSTPHMQQREYSEPMSKPSGMHSRQGSHFNIRSSIGDRNQYMQSNTNSSNVNHNQDWNRQYQSSPMTPQQSPATHYYNSRPNSSHGQAPQTSSYVPIPTALATPTPGPVPPQDQRKFLQDCTPPAHTARSFYSDGYHRSAGAPISKILDNPAPPPPPPQQQQQPQQQDLAPQQIQKPQQQQPPLQWQAPQVPQMQASHPQSQSQTPQAQYSPAQPPMQNQTEQKAQTPQAQYSPAQPPMQNQTEQKANGQMDVPEFATPGSHDLMSQLFANLRSLAERQG